MSLKTTLYEVFDRTIEQSTVAITPAEAPIVIIKTVEPNINTNTTNIEKHLNDAFVIVEVDRQEKQMPRL
jgi:hypothetical protein